MACGKPVVTSNTASLPEVVAEAGIMLDPYDHTGFAQTICRLFTEQSFRQQFIDKGIERAGFFTWRKTAQQTVEVYRKIAAKDGILTP